MAKVSRLEGKASALERARSYLDELEGEKENVTDSTKSTTDSKRELQSQKSTSSTTTTEDITGMTVAAAGEPDKTTNEKTSSSTEGEKLETAQEMMETEQGTSPSSSQQILDSNSKLEGDQASVEKEEENKEKLMKSESLGKEGEESSKSTTEASSSSKVIRAVVEEVKEVTTSPTTEDVPSSSAGIVEEVSTPTPDKSVSLSGTKQSSINKLTIEEVEEKEITQEDIKSPVKSPKKTPSTSRQVSQTGATDQPKSPSTVSTSEQHPLKEQTSTEQAEMAKRTESPLSPLLDKIERIKRERLASLSDVSDPEGEARARTPSFHWFKDGVEFEGTDRFQCQFDDEEDSLALIFQRVTPDDVGVYTCVAETSNGKISCHAQLSVHGNVRYLNRPPEKPEVKEQLSNVTAGEGTSAMIEAKVSGCPKPDVTWTHDGKEVEADGRHKMLENEEDETYALVIKNVQPEDSGDYTLKAKNELGEAETSAKLEVTSPPKFKKGLETVKTVIAGKDNLNLEVEFSGSPTPTVKWMKDGKEISEGSDSRIKIVKESEFKQKLIIEKTKEDDAGNYSAVITNSSGQQSSFSNVAVKSVPKFESDLKSVSVSEGENVVFSVIVSGNPKPTIKFLKDGKEVVDDDSHIKILDDGKGGYKLVIHNATSDDIGEYTCIAKNENGETASKGSLAIKCKPSFTRNLSDSEAKVGDQNVDFTVTIKGSPAPTVTWFLNDKQMSEGDEGIEMLHRPTSSPSENAYTLRIKDVKFSHEGKISCRASNTEGSADTFASFTVRSKPKVVKGLEDINLEELGKDVSLSVTVEGSPLPEVKWTKDETDVLSTDGNIKTVSETKISDVSASYTLLIPNVKKEDLGSYTLTATNCFGSVSTTAKISCEKDSSVLPSFTQGMKDISALQDEKNVSFVVKIAHQDQTPTIKWFVDDIEIVDEDRRYIKTSGPDPDTFTLTVTVANEGTAGSYRCTASNSKGTAETTAELTVSSKPEFMQGLEDRECLEGASIQMDVVISGNPIPEIKWFKDGKELSTTDGNVMIEKESDTVYILTIDKVTKESTGNYECVIKNRVGESKSTGALNFLSPPVFEKDLDTESTGVEGEEGILEVIVSAHPRPSVCWYKNGIKIPTQIMKENTDNRFRLRFDPIETDNDAEYYCEAKNKVGSAKSTTCRYRVSKKAADEYKPKFCQGLNDKVADAGKPLILSCIVDGNPKPTAEDIKWFKDGQEVIPDGKRIIIDYNPETGLSTLTINNVTDNDLGDYKCQVANKLGKLDTSCKVTGGAGFDKPKFTKGLSDKTAMQDEIDIELTVELDKESVSTSETKIRWFIDDIEIIEADNRFKIVSESSYIFKLIIRKADEFRTVGRYKCVATNRFGSSETSAKFDVHSPPKFIESLADKEVESPGNDVTLRVRVTGSPRPDIKWFKDGRQIYADSRVKLSVEELSSTYSLTIHDVNENDLGTYTVEAFNIVGRETSNGVLTGGSGFLKPSFKKGLSDIFVNQDATDVELMVEMNPPKARTEVKWMFNDIEISPDDDRFYFKSDESRGIYRLFIKKADKLSVGLFKCVASNEHGKTRTSGRISLKRATDFECHIPERKPIEREPFNFTSESQYVHSFRFFFTLVLILFSQLYTWTRYDAPPTP